MAVLFAAAVTTSCSSDVAGPSPTVIDEECGERCSNAVSALVERGIPFSELGFAATWGFASPSEEGSRTWYLADESWLDAGLRPHSLERAGDGVVVIVLEAIGTDNGRSDDLLYPSVVGCSTDGRSVMVETCVEFKAAIRPRDIVGTPDRVQAYLDLYGADAGVSVAPLASHTIWWSNDA